MQRFFLVARKQLPSNIFSLALSNMLRWSNFRASFVGSLATREYRDTIHLYNRVQRAYRHSPYFEFMAEATFVQSLVDEAFQRAQRTPCPTLRTAVYQLVQQLLEQEPVIFGMPQRPRFGHLSTAAMQNLRRILLIKKQILNDPAHYVDLWRENVTRLIERISQHVPPFAFTDNPSTGCRVPLIDVCENAAKAIETTVATIYDDDIVSAGFFETIRSRLDDNLCHVSGMSKHEANRTGRKLVFPTDARGKAPRENSNRVSFGYPVRGALFHRYPLQYPPRTLVSGDLDSRRTQRGQEQPLAPSYSQSPI